MTEDVRRHRKFTWIAAGSSVAFGSAIILALLRPHPWPPPGAFTLFAAICLLGELTAGNLKLPARVQLSPQLLLVMVATVGFHGRGVVLGAMLLGATILFDIRPLLAKRFAVVAFNVSQMGLAAGAGALVFEALGSTGAASRWLVYIATPLAYMVVNYGLVVPICALRSGEAIRDVWQEVRTFAVNDVIFGAFGLLLGRLYRLWGPVTVLVIVAPAIVARTLFLSIARFRQAYGRLELVYGFTKHLERTREEANAVEAMLNQFRTLLNMGVAEITVLTGRGWRRTTVSSPLAPTTTDAGDSETAHGEAAPDCPVLIADLADGLLLATELAERGRRNGMVAPLRTKDRLVGTVVLADPNDDRTLGADDLRLLDTLANHAAVFLENNRLVEQMRFDSTHDQLTGLPNRSRFYDLVATSPGPTSVLLVDLDRFKEINDTLGHDHGDMLLRAAAERIAAEVGHRGIVARLGGDEFAVLLPRTGTGDAATAAAGLLGALEQPFVVGELELEITASIGIAVTPATGEDPNKLLQQADVAMYSAKEAHSGWEMYTPDRDQYSPWRLSLAGALRRAIDANEIEVYYQPKAILANGRITGMEALVRWQHPRYGLVTPDQFVPVAEHAGLIRPLTMHVLAAACEQQRALKDRGFDLGIAVNLSVRSVLDVNLPNHIAQVLIEHGVAPSELTLEITEGSLMADPARTIGILGRLSALGTSISIDDFGTGYSSLGYLKRLPANEVKIDRSFVCGMLADASDAAIVRSTIELAHNLGLRAVAEGVEDSATWARLVDLGCDEAQGYYISEPLPVERLWPWLERSRLEIGPLP